MSETDKYYIERCLDGHQDDFRYLVRRYQGPLLVHLAGETCGRDAAEETAQEAFVRAYYGLDKLRKHESFFAWLVGIAERVLKESQRTEQRRRRGAEMLSQEVSERASPSHDIDVERAVAALPAAYRDLILLRYYGGQSCAEIAGQLRKPVGTVTKMLSRAYAMLRESLARYENSEVQK